MGWDALAQSAISLSSLEVTQQNYALAWKLLENRYDNKKLIISTHVQGIFDLQFITRESASGLRKLIDDFNKHIGALEQLGEPVKTWDTLLIHILSGKLDNHTRKAWEGSLDPSASIKVNELIAFLERKCKILETMNFSKEPVKLPRISASVITKKMSCAVCKGDHQIYVCRDFLSLNVEDRIKKIKELKLCLNCLRFSHFAKDCRSRKCKHCERSHNSLLHITPRRTTENLVAPKTCDPDHERLSVHCRAMSTRALLTTAIVLVQDKKGEYQPARALLDSGSDTNFITNAAYNKLGLNCEQDTNIQIRGIGSFVNTVRSQVQLTIKSKYADYKRRLNFLVIEDIVSTQVPPITINIEHLKIPTNIKLADKSFFEADRIDMLIGAQVFYELILNEKIMLGKRQPVLRNSQLGWLVTGTINSQDDRKYVNCNVSVQLDIQNQLEKFWQLENVEGEICKPNECEVDFVSNVKRASDNKFVVTLPMKGIELGKTGEIALKRFLSLEKRLNRDDKLKNSYCEFMSEYLQLGHMECVKNIQNIDDLNEGPGIYYIPHHAVFKASSSTTKLRVVFDASAKSSNGKSLNDILRVGPCIQEDIFSILIRFRTYNVVLTGDIEKMYRQIWINERFRDLQRILWRDKMQGPVQIFRLKTATYGTASASFLATRCLLRLAEENSERFPEASQALRNCFYMDDLVSGGKSVSEVIQLKNDITTILSNAGFNLRKFSSNNKTVLAECETTGHNKEHFLKHESETRTLGVIWDAETDLLKFESHIGGNQTTKRALLSAIASIFDPLGLLAPIILPAKVMLQKLWAKQLNWDEEVPEDLQNEWYHILEQVRLLGVFEIPRVVLSNDYERLELHGFCDASERAYGCAIYLRSINKTSIKSALLCSKSKVAPLKKITIPRLELEGALLLVRLVNRVRRILNLHFDQVKFWTDSQIVLCWINRDAAHWKMFVSNRISKIQAMTEPQQWSHICVKLNPADAVSRGVDVDKLGDNWFNGPEWLWQQHPEFGTFVAHNAEAEQEARIIALIHSHEKLYHFDKFSNFHRLIRVVSWIRRFISNCKRNNMTGTLSHEEIKGAELCLVKIVQREAFENEMVKLSKGKPLGSNSKILSLSPFIDNENVLRVGGRLKHAELLYDSKHQIILPRIHHFTTLLIKNEHVRLLHAGYQTVLANLRSAYWIINGREATKRVLRNCITCFKNLPRSPNPIMGNLPAERVIPIRPFLHVSCDCGGPYLIKDSKFRNRKFIKAYICIFVCNVTRAVHIELLTDLTSPTFLLALKRFIARRGLPKKITCDNGTNFVGARNNLREVRSNLLQLNDSEEFQDYLSSNHIEWKFLPSNSPHMGGLHEAAIKAAKCLLIKIVGDARLTYEQLYTFMCQVEASLNSRPLSPISDDPKDYQALTPGHFLIGTSLMALPEENFCDTKPARLHEYQRVQLLSQHFWKRWISEVLQLQQQKSKWRKNSAQSIKVGQLILIKDDNRPPRQWKLGRIAALHPGDDGVLRVVDLTTPHGTITRSIRGICPFPDDQDQRGEDVRL